jgi:hypothetical protein
MGVEVRFVFPPLPVSEYKLNKDVIEQYYADCKRELKIPMLCDPEAMIFDDNLFYDSHYHLDKDGREMRTDRLIEMLKRKVEN